MPTTSVPPPRSSLFWLGLLACAGYATHAGYLVFGGYPYEIIWSCHLAALLVGIGLLAGSKMMNAVGLLCLAVGLPGWIVNVLTGGSFLPTSILTHVLGLVIAIIGARSLGVPRHAWLLAWVFVFALMILTRLITPHDVNVNLAFIPVEGLFPWTFGGFAHWALLLPLWALFLYIVQVLFQRLLIKKSVVSGSDKA